MPQYVEKFTKNWKLENFLFNVMVRLIIDWYIDQLYEKDKKCIPF